MSFRERLNSASFRGVSFLVKSASLKAGRRVKIHEYPFKNEPFSEDLGKAADTFLIEAFLIGKDYDLSRDALLKALNTEGAGALIHPSLGSIQAVPTSVSLSESFGEKGGMASFSIGFTRLGKEREKGSVDESKILENLSKDAKTQAATDFNQNFNSKNQSTIVLDSAREGLFKVSSSIRNVVRRIQASAHSISKLNKDLNQFEADLKSLLNTSSEIVERMNELYASIRRISKTDAKEPLFQAKENLKALFLNQKFHQSFSNFAVITSEDKTKAQNQEAIINLNKRLSAFYCAKTATDISYKSQNEATFTIDSLNDWFFELENTNNVPLFETIQNLRIQSAKALSQKTEHLFKEQMKTVSIATPFLVFAKAESANELLLVSMNKIRDPLFCKGKLTFIEES